MNLNGRLARIERKIATSQSGETNSDRLIAELRAIADRRGIPSVGDDLHPVNTTEELFAHLAEIRRRRIYHQSSENTEVRVQ